MVSVDRQAGRIPAEVQSLASSYQRGVVMSAQEEPFWREIARFYDTAPSLFAATTEWLRSQPKPPGADGDA